MKVKIYRSIAEVDEKSWNAIVDKNRLICTYKYIKAIEDSEINDCRFFYPVVYEGNEIIAHATIYFISTELDTFAQGAVKKTIGFIRKFWKNFCILRTLECGTPIAPGNTISIKKGIDRQSSLELLCKAIERLAKEEGVKIVLFRDFYDCELESFAYLVKKGYTKIHNLPSTELKIRWSSFDEYLDSMRSQYKYKILKRMEKCKRHASIRVVNNFSIYKEEIEKLWKNVYENAKEYKRERLKSVFFENIDEYLEDRSAIILAEKGDTLIGFSLLLFDDETLTPLFFGLDYRYNKEYAVYFNLMYKAIEIAIQEGKKNIDMGITTIVPKKDIGFSVTSMNMYMKHFNGILNRIIPRAFDAMTPQDKSEPRRVFKTAVSEKTHEKIIVSTSGHSF